MVRDNNVSVAPRVTQTGETLLTVCERNMAALWGMVLGLDVRSTECMVPDKIAYFHDRDLHFLRKFEAFALESSSRSTV